MSQKDKYIMSNELKARKQVVTLCLNTSTKIRRAFAGMSHGWRHQGHLKFTRIKRHAIDTQTRYLTVDMHACLEQLHTHKQKKKLDKEQQQMNMECHYKTQQQNKNYGTEKDMGKQNSAPTSSVHLWCLSVVVALKLRRVSSLLNYTPKWRQSCH